MLILLSLRVSHSPFIILFYGGMERELTCCFVWLLYCKATCVQVLYVKDKLPLIEWFVFTPPRILPPLTDKFTPEKNTFNNFIQGMNRISKAPDKWQTLNDCVSSVIVKKYQKETLTRQENFSCQQHIYKVCGERLYGAKYTCSFFCSKDGNDIWTATSFLRATTYTKKWQINVDQHSELSTLRVEYWGGERGWSNEKICKCFITIWWVPRALSITFFTVFIFCFLANSLKC